MVCACVLGAVETVEAATSPVVEYLGTMFGIHSNTLFEEEAKEASGVCPVLGANALDLESRCPRATAHCTQAVFVH